MTEPDNEIKKFVSMVLMGVPEIQIAEVFGLPLNDLQILKQTPEFQTAFQEASQEYYDKQGSTNKTWDDVEKSAITIVQDTLKYSKDADYALKVAVLANKAQRRTGAAAQQPLQAAQGRAVVLHMNQNFMLQLRGGEEIAKRPIVETSHVITGNGSIKKTNLLSPKNIVDMFTEELDDSNTQIAAAVKASNG